MEELSKSFDPSLIETYWSNFWKKESCFVANPKSPKPAYCIVIPPPNVTGVLHMGHALVNTLQDVLVRWKRMSGFEVLWVPGTDHAGIATQTVVERDLMKRTGKRRKEFSREEFLSHVWAWKEKSEKTILSQLSRLGCSFDLSRLCFTMDEQRNLAVCTMFKKLFDQGLIYKGDYLVNWDPVAQTALADDEVEHEEKHSFLWHFAYPLADDPSVFIPVATTRPETLLGDVAVAVCPNDSRYNTLIGKFVKLPLMDRLIPIIADHHVDPTFGSGAVKVTPAHDPNDYEIGMRHNLPFINIMTPDGKINEQGGSFTGLTMEEARNQVVAAMNTLKLLIKTEPHVHKVGISYRSKAVIEPYISKQWFVKISSFKTHLKQLVTEKKVKFIPENWENTYFHWIDNLRDWCISRQLWWGHRIPIFFSLQDPTVMICSADGRPPQEVLDHPEKWKQEEDVLDTWFSSALWPFSTLGWPNKTAELSKFYPNSTLVTGHDILFFWVARMMFMGTYALDTPPFPETFLHGLIYGKSYWKKTESGDVEYITGDARVNYDLGEPTPQNVHFKWEKMSKSKGNILDPLEIIDLYGTDATRMALCSSATQARQIDLDRRRFEEFKNFANKVWNGARFVFMNIQDLSTTSFSEGLNVELFTLEDSWILSMLNKLCSEIDQHLTNYHFDKAALVAYEFFWKEFCAYYVEIVKPILSRKTGSDLLRTNKQKILAVTLLSITKLLHPMAPFITEQLFSIFKNHFSEPLDSCCPYVSRALLSLKEKSCCLASYPKALETPNDAIEKDFSLLHEVVHAIRNVRAEMQIPPNIATDVFITGETSLIENNKNLITSLVKTTLLEIGKACPSSFSAKKIINSVEITIPLPQELREKEKQRLVKEEEKISKLLSSLELKFLDKEFTEKAPKEILDKLSRQLEEAKLTLQNLTEKKQFLN